MSFDPISAIFDTANTVLTKFFPDANLREQAARQLATELNLQVMGQIELNKVEAASTSMFVAGWRPALGWICVGSFAYEFVLQPMMVFVLAAAGQVVILPHLDSGELIAILGGMLGLGGMRTFEKMKGLTK